MKTILIKQNDENQRLDKFLTKTFKALPVSLMYKYIRTKKIKLNKKRCYINSILKKDDIIDLYIKDEFLENSTDDKYDFLKAPDKINIVYEDDNILLVNKPLGLLVHSDKNNLSDSLICRILHYLYNSGFYDPDNENSFTPALVNRIDRNTCGIVICAKNAASLRILNQKLKDREIQKFYLALVHGFFLKHSDTLTAYLIKNEDQNRVYIYDNRIKGSKTIKTKYTVVKEFKNKNMTLIKVQLLTGRTHQIRAHMAYINHPLIGDGKYGKNDVNKKYKYKKQALCSYKLSFNFSSDSGILQYLNNKSFEISFEALNTQFFSRFDAL
ncbi:MAG: RluA family pseudouridine synthase [Clostridia bacterium]|nr:RluA family pseudouridine synthase [Clostridia bacterium]